ncbi:HAD family hydrolase [Kitasatospora phosalacinea]|uniref:HAD family hydrolase n=1 Tax=Kitasatospora phosalacinea TaxID=2065 RepID=UPI0035DC8F59
MVFDNDGVLVDSERLANEILASLLTRCGVPTTLESSIQDHMGTTLTEVRRTAEARGGRLLPEDFEDRYRTELDRAFRAELVAVPGMRELLAELTEQGRPFCVASSSDHDRLDLSHQLTGIAEFVDGRVFSAQEVRRGKPAPDLFLHAAARMGVEPADCVVVEDSPAGVTAARAAGMAVIGFAATTPAERLHEADCVVSTAADLLKALGSAPGSPLPPKNTI